MSEIDEGKPSEIVDCIKGVPIWDSKYNNNRYAWYEDWVPCFDDPTDEEDFLEWCEKHKVVGRVY